MPLIHSPWELKHDDIILPPIFLIRRPPTLSLYTIHGKQRNILKRKREKKGGETKKYVSISERRYTANKKLLKISSWKKKKKLMIDYLMTQNSLHVWTPESWLLKNIV